MLTIHHLGISQSERIVWLCEELDIAYALVRYDRDPLTRLAPDAYKALHPIGTAPVVTDGDVVLAESGAIIDYIMARHSDGRLGVAPEAENFADYLFWYHFANGSLMPSAMIDLVVNAMGSAGEKGIGHVLRSRLDRGYDMVEQRLGGVPYFAGESLTAADIMMVFPLTTMRVFAPRDLLPYPNIRSYLLRIGDRPAYQRAMAKADRDFLPRLI